MQKRNKSEVKWQTFENVALGMNIKPWATGNTITLELALSQSTLRRTALLSTCDALVDVIDIQSVLKHEWL